MNIPLIIVLMYVVLLFGISIYVSSSQKKNKDTDNFLLFKGKSSALVVAASIAGLAIGGASTIGIAENAFTVGLSAGWYDVAWAIGAVVSSFLAVKYLRRSGYSTISGLVSQLYGTRTSFIMVIAMCIIQSGIIALQYKAGGSILASLLPDIFTVKTGTFFSFLIFMAVAVIGGMGSVSLTNVLNLILIYVGVILAAALVLWNHGGWAAINTLTTVTDPDTPYLSLTAGMGWMGILSWIVVMMGNANGVQGAIQIGLTGKTERSATTGYLIGAALMIPVGFICALLGVASRALMPDAEASVALPMILMSVPPVLGGITLSGLWAADMGTGCSMIIGLATTVSSDIIQKIPGVKLDTRQRVLLNKLIVVISSIVTYLIATQMGAILGAMQKALSMAIGTAFIVIGGLLFPNFTGRRSGFWTILASIMSIIAWNLLPQLKPVFNNVGFFMLAICGAVFIISSLLDPVKVGGTRTSSSLRKAAGQVQ